MKAKKMMQCDGSVASQSAVGLIQEYSVVEAQCRILDGFIVFDVNDEEYAVELRRCSSPNEVLGWVENLSEKKWMTVALLRRFVRLAVQHHGIQIYNA